MKCHRTCRFAFISTWNRRHNPGSLDAFCRLCRPFLDPSVPKGPCQDLPPHTQHPLVGRRQEGVLGDQGVGLHGAGGLRRQTMGVERSTVTPKIYYEHAY